MKTILIIDGIEYVLLSELINKLGNIYSVFSSEDFSDYIFDFHGRKYISLSNAQNIEKHLVIYRNNYDSKYVVRKYDIRLSEELSMIKRHIKNIKYQGEIYFDKNEIDKYNSLTDFYKDVLGVNVIPASELVKHYNSRKERIFFLDNLQLTESALKLLYGHNERISISGRLFIKMYENVYDDFEERCKTFGEKEFFYNYLSPKKEARVTWELMKDFYFSELNHCTSPSRNKLFIKILKIFAEIYDLLDKELYLYDIDWISNYILSNSTYINHGQVVKLLNTIKKKYPSFCPEIKGEFVRRANNWRTQYKKEILDAKKFAMIKIEAINIDRHLFSALQDYYYAQSWLYVLVLLSNFWRSSDVLSLEPIDSYQNINNEYLYDNRLTLVESSKICNNFEICAKKILIKKNLKKRRVYIPEDHKQALATALVICSNFAREKKLKTIISCAFDCNRLFNKLGEPFSYLNGRIMNYTLATYFEAEGESEGGKYRSEVYDYISIMRSHKRKNSLDHSEVTQTYIQSQCCEEVEEISFHLSQRGGFGWMYHVLLNLSGIEFDSMGEETDYIVALQRKYDPQAIESIAQYIYFEASERKNILEQIRKWDRAEISSFLKNCGTIGTYKQSPDLPCIMGNNCPNVGRKCTLCQWSVKTIHSMMIFSEEIDETIKEIENTENTNTIKKYAFQLVRLLRVVLEFEREYGKDYVSVFVDMDKIKEKLKEMEIKKLKIIGELKNEFVIEGRNNII